MSLDPSLDPSTFAALSSAAAVRGVGIVHRCAHWEVWVRVGETLAESRSHPIHTTPGERHQWSSIDAAYTFVRNQGYRGTVEVDDAIAGAGDGPGAALATPAPESLPAPQPVVPAVSGPPRPQVKDKQSTRSPLTLTTPPKKSTTTPTRTTTSRPRPLSGPHRSTRPGTRPTPKDPQG